MFPTQPTGFEFDLTNLLVAGPAVVSAAPEGASALDILVRVVGVVGVVVWLVVLFALVGADISRAISDRHRAHLTHRRRAGSHGRVLR